MKKIWLCIKSFFYRVDIGVIDSGAISITASCDFSEYTVEILDDDLNSIVPIKVFSSLEEARIYGININWFYPFTDETKTILIKDNK